ncbi:MAG: serine/threonine-protein kinase [Acidobacteriota bacterium]|nr:serine/threonine-protein kinase [Acidobacteriota bacterium]
MTKKIGRYEIESEIGRGAMGIVYLARDTRLDRRVALKTYALPSGLTAEQEREFQERFEREARAAAALSHPGIVTVYDVDRDGERGTPYITMEYVEGESLDDLLARRESLDPDEACSIASQVADALHTAHTAGIVHRDVKPGNILIRAGDGRVKLADFGVARLRESELTRSGAAVGSPGYMSPEQIRGEPVDGRADLFSLGVILYRMLSGRAPFEGDDLPALVYSIAHQTPVPITRRVSGLPCGLGGFIDRALAKTPGDRFADGHAFREALSLAMESDEPEPGEKTVVDPARSGPWSVPVSSSATDLPFGVPPGDTGKEGRPRRFRVSRRWVAGFGALLLIVLAIAWLSSDPAYIEFHGRSTVEEGELTLFIDGEQVYSRELAFTGNRNSLQKFVDKLRPAAGGETFEAVIKTSPGRHEVEALLAESGSGEEYRSSVVVELDDRATERLKVIAGKLHGAPLTLKRD